MLLNGIVLGRHVSYARVIGVNLVFCIKGVGLLFALLFASCSCGRRRGCPVSAHSLLHLLVGICLFVKTGISRDGQIDETCHFAF